MGMVVGEPAKLLQVSHQIPFANAVTSLVLEFAFYTASLVVLVGGGLWALAIGGGRTAGVSVALSTVIATAATAIFASRRRPSWFGGWPQRAGTIVVCELTYHALGIAEIYYTLL